jgi:hypothetical protein
VNGNRPHVFQARAHDLPDVIPFPARATLGSAEEAALAHAREGIVHLGDRSWIAEVLLARDKVLPSVRIFAYPEDHRLGYANNTSLSHSGIGNTPWVA